MSADLVLMRCEARNLKLTTKGCARLYEAAQNRTPDPWESTAPCKFCPIGAAHAGKTVPPMAKAVSDLRNVCPRCLRTGARLIKGHHCVSCYNRAREADVGRNRKGNRPALSDALHTEVLTVANGPDVVIQVSSKVATRVEAIMAMAKAANGPLAFGLAPLFAA
ncbi:MAG TPA: hypothetical protein VGC15_06765 [Acetobacteraceae bacterium]